MVRNGVCPSPDIGGNSKGKPQASTLRELLEHPSRWYFDGQTTSKLFGFHQHYLPTKFKGTGTEEVRPQQILKLAPPLGGSPPVKPGAETPGVSKEEGHLSSARKPIDFLVTNMLNVDVG